MINKIFLYERQYSNYKVLYFNNEFKENELGYHNMLRQFHL